MALDGSGNIYGVTVGGGDTNGDGVLFEVSGTSETVLHTFNQTTDGANPIGGVLVSTADGSIYGTASTGGQYYDGLSSEATFGSVSAYRSPWQRRNR